MLKHIWDVNNSNFITTDFLDRERMKFCPGLVIWILKMILEEHQLQRLNVSVKKFVMNFVKLRLT